MRLTMHTDYALRVLIYLGLNPERVVPIHEISRAYGISQAHLVKVQQHLAALGYVEATRGRRGGVQLARAPETIRVGDVVRGMEPLDLVECFDAESDTCPITAYCGLKPVLAKAQRSFLHVLDEYTLDMLIRKPRQLTARLRAST